MADITEEEMKAMCKFTEDFTGEKYMELCDQEKAKLRFMFETQILLEILDKLAGKNENED